MYMCGSRWYDLGMVTRRPMQRDVIACCAPVQATMPDQDQAEVLAKAFAALADPTRLRLLSFIASASTEEVCACDLLEPAGKSQPTVSHHMKILIEAGVVAREKRGLWVWYRVVPGRLEILRAVLG